MCDVKRRSSGRIFLSYPHTHDRFLYYLQEKGYYLYTGLFHHPGGWFRYLSQLYLYIIFCDVIIEMLYLLYQMRGHLRIFCPSLGTEVRPHSQSEIATFFPIPCQFFPIKKSKKQQHFLPFLETTTIYEKKWPITEWYLNTCA